jgi:flavin reductase (DIM6/NTAB) family NADH-FMN oxidoreductase RutF
MREQLDALVTMADGAMIVVTVATDEERGGCLVGFHSQSSIDPWRYTVHISKANHTYGVALEATHVLVHFLDEGMHDVARVFGTLTDDGHLLDKFALIEWAPGPDARTPLLRGVDNWFLGRVLTRHDDGGDHVAFVLDAEQASARATRFRPMRLGDVVDLHAGHPA